ncbi:MAG: M50 family metallopeptidase [Candidatus Nanopelagicales bacterium]
MSSDGSGAGARGGLALRIGSIPVLMPWSGVLGVLLIAYLWAPSFSLADSGGSRQVITSLVFALLFYASILLHELGHAALAKVCGYPVHQIVLWVLGGFTSYERRDDSSWREGVIAAAGPATSLLLGGACALAVSRGVLGTDDAVLAVAGALAWSNIFLGIYNALPGLPLDGGAVLKGIVWALTRSERRGTLVAGWAGRVLAVAVFVGPLLPDLLAGRPPSLTLVVFGAMIGAYLFAGATAALRSSAITARVPTLSVAQLARPAVPVVRDLPLAEALRQVAAASAGAFVVVGTDGRAVAVGHEDAVRAVPEQRRPWVPASSVAKALDPAAVLSSSLAGEPLLAALRAHPATEYLVLDDQQRIFGVLSTADVEAALTRA